MLHKKNILIYIFLFIIGYAFVRDTLFLTDELEKEKQSYHLHTQKVIDMMLKLQKEKMSVTAELLTRLSSVKEGLRDDIPALIFDELQPFWNKIKQENLISEIHFFKPPATSFANFTTYRSSLDDVSDVRSDIVYVTQSMKSSAHVMMCKTYGGIRGAFPIIDDDGSILGGLSFGHKLDWLAPTLQETIGSSAFFVYEKDKTKSLMPKFYELFVEDKRVFDKYLLANETITIQDSEFNSIDFDHEIQDMQINNINYALHLYNLEDFEGNSFGYVGVLHSLDQFYTEFYIGIAKELFLLFVVGLLVYFVIAQKAKHIEQRFDEQSKLATLGEMIDNIAHQWRQPLSFISTSASSIQLKKEMGMLDAQDEDKMLQKIVDTSQEMSLLINDFESFLHEERVPVYFKISKSIQRAQKFTLTAIEKHHIQIITDVDDIEIISIENELTQVLINIINACKNRLVNISDKKYIFINTIKEKKGVAIKIYDNSGVDIDSIKDETIVIRYCNNIVTKVCEYEYEDKKYKGIEYTLKIAQEK